MVSVTMRKAHHSLHTTIPHVPHINTRTHTHVRTYALPANEQLVTSNGFRMRGKANNMRGRGVEGLSHFSMQNTTTR